MVLNDLLEKKQISRYRLSKDSGIPQATVADLCTGKTRITKCSAETLYKIAKTLRVPMESLIEAEIENQAESPRRMSFEVFKSNVCHLVKDQGAVDFIIDTLESDEIRKLYKRKWYPKAFYLLAMVDYLSNKNEIPLCSNYNDVRKQHLREPLYPTGVLLSDAALHTNQYKEEARRNAIPEFLHFNIIECEVQNVC